MKEAALAAEPSADGTKAKGKGRGGKGRGKGKKGRGRGKEQAKENKNKDVVEEKKEDDEKENENKVEVDEVVPELPKEVEDPPPAIPTEPVPPVPAAKKRARSQKTAPNEGSASSGLPKSSKKIKNGKGEQTAEASHEGKGTQATKRKNKEPETKKTRDGDGVETKKKKHGASCEGGAATFARRVQPTSDFGKAKWLALRSMFATHIKPHLEHYSAHEDVYQFLCILFFFIIVEKKVKTKAFPFQGIHLSICSFYIFVFFLCPIKVLVLNR